MIEIVDVSPRDGLQNEASTLTTASKIALVDRLIDAGTGRIEVASFVNPARVPQMADGEAVIAGLRRIAGVRYIGLVLNDRGVERALATAIDEIGLVCAATDRFAVANQNMSAEQTLAMAERAIATARAAGRDAQATIAVAFGCPFEGAVDPARVVAIARRIAAAGAIEVALADTIGVARPHEVERLVAAVVAACRPLPVRVHFHDTRGTGVANVCAAIRHGAVTVDASVGGTGGCPFAPGAAGNVATEEVVYALGDKVAVDYEKTTATGAWLNRMLGK